MERSNGVGSNAFLETLNQLRRGLTSAELSIELGELISAVKKTGKKGALIFRLQVLPNAEGTVHVEDSIDVRCPKMPRKSTLFYVTDDNRLQRTDPNQGEFKLNVIEGEKIVPPVAVAAE